MMCSPIFTAMEMPSNLYLLTFYVYKSYVM